MGIPKTLLLLACLLPIAAECEQSYRVYTEHPRLWLDARRLRLLRRERERQSVRWQQLQLLRKMRRPLPEEPLLAALEYQVADEEAAGHRAVQWALERAAAAEATSREELRLLAVVFDWCYPLFGEKGRTRVAERMAHALDSVSSQPGIRSFSTAALTAIAFADEWPGSETALTAAFETRWRNEFLPALREGKLLGAAADRVAFLEMCHAVQHNLNLDLWNQAPAFFKQFPFSLLLEYYPPPVTIAGHRFRWPSEASGVRANPALQGELARMAELLTAAYETNSVETQFLQGWITHDIYRLRTPSGAPYEYLWMNPYQPGLSYYNVPLHLHDEIGGRLLARSSWDDDAAWVGYFDGELQLFADGRRTLVDLKKQTSPIVFPQLAVVPAAGNSTFRVRLAEGDDVFVVALEPGKTYRIRMGTEKSVPYVAGKGGILHLKAEPGAETTFDLLTAEPSAPAAERKKGK